MRCEFCSSKLRSDEIAHGIRYGTVDDRTDCFLPDRASAPTVICQHCGEQLLRLIYQKIK